MEDKRNLFVRPALAIGTAIIFLFFVFVFTRVIRPRTIQASSPAPTATAVIGEPDPQPTSTSDVVSPTPIIPLPTADPHPTLVPSSSRCEDPAGENWVMVAVGHQGCGIFVREVGVFQGCQFSWSNRENPCLGKTIDVFVNDVPYTSWKGYYLNLLNTTANHRSWWLKTYEVNRLTLPNDGGISFGAFPPRGVTSIDASIP